MPPHSHRTRAIVVAMAMLAAGGTLVARHLTVVRSAPAANESLQASPTAIQIWFNQAPARGVSQITLGTASDPKTEVEIDRATIDAEAKSMTARVPKPLAPGAYVIRWRGAGDDGHVQNGEIKFTIAPARWATSR